MEPQISKMTNNLFKNSKTVKVIIALFGLFLAGLAVTDLLIHPHPYFGVDGWPEFNPVFGFVSGMVLVACAKALSLLVRSDHQ